MPAVRRIAGCVVTGLALVLAGCGGRPQGILLPAASDVASPGTSRVDMIVATTRSSVNALPGEMFTGERGRKVAYADISVSLPPDGARQIGEVQWPERLPGNPAKNFVTLRAQALDQPGLLRTLDARLAQARHKRVLVFIHGFNTRFEEAVYRFAQIAHDSNAPAVPVLFTWPSRGKLLAYAYDRESANYSRDALETLLQSLIDDRNVGEITVLAHSMGNWVTLEAQRQLAIRKGRVSPKITDIMLAAPDVDFDVFGGQIADLGPTHPPITLFVSRDDAALAVSRRLWGNQARAGAIDPTIEPYRSELAKARITTVDLTDVKSGDSLNHGTFAQSPEVVRMIGARLAAGQTLNDGGAGFGEKLGQIAAGAATTVGSAAGIIVSAPFAIVDGRTRDSLGDQIEDFGSNAGETVRSAGNVVTAPGR